ncbi:winged helix-turn-helix domain-containing protein [Streptomyces sp. NPDC005349]|uniref:helix-turn-helix domain-containing protein n=1 Tax=Streptomyces sp. NPDC005349 TaxID=3157037 RepID=UPI0033B78A42
MPRSSDRLFAVLEEGPARIETLVGRRFHKSFTLSGIALMLRRHDWSHQVPARRDGRSLIHMPAWSVRRYVGRAPPGCPHRIAASTEPATCHREEPCQHVSAGPGATTVSRPPPYDTVPNGSCTPIPGTPPEFIGRHIPNRDWAFEMTEDPSKRGDGTVVSDWTDGFDHCAKCGVLFTTEAGGDHCMASGQHPAGTSYQLPTSWGPFEHFKSGWKVCGRCGVLFFAGGGDFDGSCPADTTHHAVSVEFGVEFWL